MEMVALKDLQTGDVITIDGKHMITITERTPATVTLSDRYETGDPIRISIKRARVLGGVYFGSPEFYDPVCRVKRTGE